MFYKENNFSAEKTAKLMRIATIFSVITASSIVCIKIFAWIMTDSLSLLSSLADSTLDILSSLINLFALHYSLKPADEDHRFGHGKAEDIAALAQSAFIAGSGLFITIESIARIINPQVVENAPTGIIVMVISTILTVFLVMFQTFVIKLSNSTVIKADSLHYKTDILVNIMVIISFFIVMVYDTYIIDSVIALFIAVYIFKAAWGVGKEAFDKLMDKEFDDDKRAQIIEIAISNEKVMGIHDLKTRSSGIKPFIQFHLELDGTLQLKEAHKITDIVEKSILEAFPGSEVIIHQDPVTKKPIDIKKNPVVPLKKK